MRALLAVIAILAGAGALHAAHYAVMTTGTRVRIERWEAVGSVTRLVLEGGGVVEVETGSIRAYESDEYLPSPAHAPVPWTPSRGDLRDLVEIYGKRHGLDPDLIHSVIRAESGGNPRAVSPKGASGLMQLMPQTAQDLQVTDVFDPGQNVNAGTRYLRRLLGQYNNDLHLALAAYNAGPHKVDTYRGIPPYRETREYVGRVIRDFNRRKTSK